MCVGLALSNLVNRVCICGSFFVLPTPAGSRAYGVEQDDLLRDSDEDVGGGTEDAMADEIASMLADLRSTGEAEDDADADMTLVCCWQIQMEPFTYITTTTPKPQTVGTHIIMLSANIFCL